MNMWCCEYSGCEYNVLKGMAMRKVLLVVLIAILPCLAKAAVEDSLMVKRVLDYYEAAAPEQVIVNTDKDVYMPGSKVSFLAYVVSEAENIDSRLTNFLYLDLYRNDGWQRISHKKYIRNENGSFSNCVEIPESLPPGDYTIVGYTQHLLGFPADKFAYKIIKVGEVTENTIGDLSRCELQLFPEGGRYIAGEVQKVGVRVIGNDNLTGVYRVEVVDSIGEVLYSTETDRYGYATVKLRNDSLNTLRVNVRGSGYLLSAEVPEAETDCAALKVSQGEDILKIGILKHGDIDLSAMNVVVRASGVVFSLAADRVSQVKIPLSALPDGYIIIDLVDDTNKTVVSTRRVFKEADQNIKLSF